MPESIILYDKAAWRRSLLPFCAIRPVGNLRVGICTLNEKWNLIFHHEVSYITEDYLQNSFSSPSKHASSYLIIKANLLPNEAIIDALNSLKDGERLMHNQHWVAARIHNLPENLEKEINNLKPIDLNVSIQQITFPEDIFIKSKSQILLDYNLLTKGRTSQSLNNTNSIYGDWIFIEEGARIEGTSLNSLEGPIFIGKNATLEEGCFLKGYVGIGEGSRIKMGAKLYPNVSIGPKSTVSGEVNNSVIWGNSAKGHHGYLGCSVLGEGCNIGAGSSNSNLKNNWKSVKLYDYQNDRFRETDILKCGLLMGDYAMSAINSSFNTGTVIGVGSQIAISKFIPQFVPDFSWLTDENYMSYNLEKFTKMLKRRSESTAVSPATSSEVFHHIYQQTEELRNRIINH